MVLPKRPSASSLLLDFLIWAVLSLLSTRLFLYLTGNFALGRGDWHIAHVLWGGLFMLLAIIIFLIFSGKSSLKYASIFAGIGWGMFIDEIGKYLTRDNNYWFRPAIIFIYISFILLFFLYRILEKKKTPTRSVLWHALLEDCQELVNDDLEIKEKRELLQKIKALENFSLSSSEKKLLLSLKTSVENTPPKNDRKIFSFSRFLATSLNITYNRLFKRRLIFYGLFVYSLWYIGDKLVDALHFLFYSDKLILLQNYYHHYDFFSKADVYMISLKFIVEVISALLFAIGLYFWFHRKYIKGIKFYQFGLLTNILIGSIFKFYFEQFSGVFSLIIALVIWTWLDNYRRDRLLSLSRLS